jgi:hypothetical protein
MNSISNQLPSLADSLASLAAQTQSASDNSIAAFAEPDTTASAATSDPTSDTLQLSGSSGETELQITARDVALQNRFSVLADSSAALTATNAATSLLGSSASNATAAQANLSAGNVLNLLAES